MEFVILYGLDDQIQVGIVLKGRRQDKTHTEAALKAMTISFSRTHTSRDSKPRQRPPAAYTNIGGDVLVLVINAQRNGDEFLEGLLHPLLVADGVVAQDEVEARLDVRALAHDVLEGRDGVDVLAHADEDQADVLHDLDPHLLVGVRDLVHGHPVHLNGLGVVLLFDVDVAHVDF